MSFKYSVIGDNSQENREWLEMLGYVPFMWDEYDNKQPYIATMGDNEFCSVTHEDLHNNMCSVRVNCIGNPQLFQAVSAIREDSDYMQWFENDYEMSYKDVVTGKWEKTKWFRWNCKKSKCLYGHKATLSELQEHFK